MKQVRLFLVIPATNISSEMELSGVKRIKTYLCNSTTSNWLNHYMAVHIHAEDVDKKKQVLIGSSLNTVRNNYTYSAEFKYMSIFIE